MTGRLVDMAFTLGGKQRVTLEINGDFREIWDKLHQEQVLDVEIKKHREKRSLSENGKDYSCYFVYKESHKMDSKEFARLVDGAIEEAKELGIQTDTPEQLARYKEEWSK